MINRCHVKFDEVLYETLLLTSTLLDEWNGFVMEMGFLCSSACSFCFYNL